MYETVYLTRARKLDRRCIKGRQGSGVDLITQETNKHQLIHRITSVETPLIYKSIKEVYLKKEEEQISP